MRRLKLLRFMIIVGLGVFDGSCFAPTSAPIEGVKSPGSSAPVERVAQVKPSKKQGKLRAGFKRLASWLKREKSIEVPAHSGQEFKANPSDGPKESRGFLRNVGKKLYPEKIVNFIKILLPRSKRIDAQTRTVIGEQGMDSDTASSEKSSVVRPESVKQEGLKQEENLSAGGFESETLEFVQSPPGNKGANVVAPIGASGSKSAEMAHEPSFQKVGVTSKKTPSINASGEGSAAYLEQDVSATIPQPPPLPAPNKPVTATQEAANLPEFGQKSVAVSPPPPPPMPTSVTARPSPVPKGAGESKGLLSEIRAGIPLRKTSASAPALITGDVLRTDPSKAREVLTSLTKENALEKVRSLFEDSKFEAARGSRNKPEEKPKLSVEDVKEVAKALSDFETAVEGKLAGIVAKYSKDKMSPEEFGNKTKNIVAARDEAVALLPDIVGPQLSAGRGMDSDDIANRLWKIMNFVKSNLHDGKLKKQQKVDAIGLSGRYKIELRRGSETIPEKFINGDQLREQEHPWLKTFRETGEFKYEPPKNESPAPIAKDVAGGTTAGGGVPTPSPLREQEHPWLKTLRETGEFKYELSKNEPAAPITKDVAEGTTAGAVPPPPPLPEKPVIGDSSGPAGGASRSLAEILREGVKSLRKVSASSKPAVPERPKIPIKMPTDWKNFAKLSIEERQGASGNIKEGLELLERLKEEKLQQLEEELQKEGGSGKNPVIKEAKAKAENGFDLVAEILPEVVKRFGESLKIEALESTLRDLYDSAENIAPRERENKAGFSAEQLAELPARSWVRKLKSILPKEPAPPSQPETVLRSGKEEKSSQEEVEEEELWSTDEPQSTWVAPTPKSEKAVTSEAVEVPVRTLPAGGQTGQPISSVGGTNVKTEVPVVAKSQEKAASFPGASEVVTSKSETMKDVSQRPSSVTSGSVKQEQPPFGQGSLKKTGLKLW